MKDFTYIIYDDYISLRTDECKWLSDMGLHETRWILDRAWFFYYELLLFEEWIVEGW